MKDTENGKLHCNRYGFVFSINQGERADVNSHLGSEQHEAAVEVAASSSRVASFFLNEFDSNAGLAIAAKEVTFAYYTANHEQSFKSSGCTPKLVSKLFESKFSLGRTKRKATVVNAISPM